MYNIRRGFNLLMAMSIVVMPIGGEEAGAGSFWSMPGNYGYKNITGGVEVVDYQGEGGVVEIPEIIDGKPVKVIGEGSFKDKGITEVNFPESLEHIENEAFKDNNISIVTIPKSVKVIGTGVFSGNYDLEKVKILSNNVEIKGTEKEEGLVGNKEGKEFTIEGKVGSTSEEYAELIGYNFIGMEVEEEVKDEEPIKIHIESIESLEGVKEVTVEYRQGKVKEMKWEEGEMSEEYFKDSGIRIDNNQFRVAHKGVYTVYVEEESGLKSIKTFQVEDNLEENLQLNLTAITRGYEVDIKVNVGGLGENKIDEMRWGEGEYGEDYFKYQGTTFTGDTLTVNKSGMYTVYVKDTKGNELVEKIGVKILTVGELPIGSKIVDENTLYKGEPIVWLVADRGKEGFPEGSTTLIADDIISKKAYDSIEVKNEDENRREFGGTDYKGSNIRQWLNSEGEGWYELKNKYDEPPVEDKVSKNEYKNEEGFMSGFSEEFKSKVRKTKIEENGEILKDSVFLISKEEAGLIEGGDKLKVFSNPKQRESEKYGSEAKWWLRTKFNEISVDVVNGDKGSGEVPSNGEIGVRPALNVKEDVAVSLHPNEEGHYEVVIKPDKKSEGAIENGEGKMEINSSTSKKGLNIQLPSISVQESGKIGEELNIGFDEEIEIEDNVGEGWRLEVSSTKMKISEEDGVPKESVGLELKPGTVLVAPVEEVYRKTGTGGIPKKVLGELIGVDEGGAVILESDKGVTGKYGLKIGKSGLRVNLKGDVTLVEGLGETPYETTITWTLISSP